MDELWTIASQNTALLLAIGIVVLSFLLGQLLRRYAIDRAAEWLRRSRWRVDEGMVRSVRRPVTLWCTLGGVYVASLLVALEPEMRALIGDILQSVLIISLTFWFADVVVRMLMLTAPGRPGRSSPITGVVQNVVRTFVLVMGIVLLLGNLGISVAPMLTTLGIGGLAVALGLQETLSNVFAGMQLTIARNIKLGDVVKLESGEDGVVEDIGWRSARIRRILHETVVLIPNSRLAGSIVHNYDLPTTEIGVLVDVGVHYKSDLERVEAVTLDVAREVLARVDGAVPGFVPYLRYMKFGESSIDFTVVLRAVGYREMLAVRHEFIKQLSARYARESIVIPFPIRAINLDQEHAVFEHAPRA